MPQERAGAVTLGGKPLTLVGPALKPGDKAPDFTCLDRRYQPAGLKSFQGKFKVLASVFSLDTSVCTEETKKFNELAATLPENAVIAVVSMDQPVTQGRWCGANGVDKVVTLSDFKDKQFGEQYGVLVKERGHHSRAVFLIDQSDVIRYVEYVPEVGSQPNFDALKAAVSKLTGK
ncbi:MAG: thiol peroxidase [Chloroflexi bacterium]|nr:thiol peroxidase [Chloroflexota bacterium]